MSNEPDWTNVSERGSPWFFRLLIVIHRYHLLNWWGAYVLIYPIVTVCFLTEQNLRRISADYLSRLYEATEDVDGLEHEPNVWDSYRHFLEFGRSVFDRFCLWMGYKDRYQFRHHGQDLLYSYLERDRGGILLSFHIGSFDLMRFLALERDITVNIIAFWDNAPMVNQLLKEINPTSHMHLIKLDPSNPQSMLEIKNCIDRGEFIAILGDRTSVGNENRTTEVEFLGCETELPEGPYVLSDVLGCPVLLTYTLRTGFRSYEVHAEEFADPVDLPRDSRSEAIQRYAQQYADRMEDICRQAPYQWFNFFDFWDDLDG